MGELIRKIGELRIKEKIFDVELNESEGNNGEKIIHIQNKNIRYEMSESQFIDLCINIVHAKNNLDKLKGEDDEIK